MGLNSKFERLKTKHYRISKIRILFSVSILSFSFLLTSPALALDNPEQKATEAIKNFIQSKYPDWAKAEIRLTFKLAESAFHKMKALDETTEFQVLEVLPDFKPAGNVIFPLAAGSAEASKKYLLRAKVEVIKNIAAAARLIKKGKIIETADLKMEERDVALLPPKYFVNESALIGKEAKITIPQNSTIFEWLAGESPLVRRGQAVNLIVTSLPALSVKTKAEALEDGYLNNEIRVKRVDSKKIISGKLISKSEVEVKL